MKRVLVIVGVVLVLMVGALFIAPQFIPTDVYRQKIEATASQALGREVKITGQLHLSLIPRIEARAGAATIANPAGFGDAPFASMKELRAAVKLIPLIFQKVEIDEFVLVEPTIGLVKLENGQNNWTFKIGEQKDKTKSDSALNAALGDVRIIDGKVSYDDRAAKQLQTVSKFNLKADMKAIDKPFAIKASGLANDLPFDFDAKIQNPKAMMDGQATQIDLAFNTKLASSKLNGTLALGDTPKFDFKFDGQVPAVPALADAFHLADLPARAVLGSVSASGQAIGSPDDMTLKIADARHQSALLNANFHGDIRLAKEITLQLQAEADAPRLADLAAAMKIDAPAGAALGKAVATTTVSGPLSDLHFTNVNFKHDSGLLGITFTGEAELAKAITYKGHISMLAPDLHQLAASAGAKLPEGKVYRSFSLSGDTSGSATDVLLKNATVEFDDIRGQGEAAISFAGKPKLTGSLATGLIDATPYANASGAPKDEKKSGGWGNDPIDLSPLKLADADLDLSTAGLKYQKFDFGPSKVAVTLRSGKLTADLKQTSLFGGSGGATIVADGSGATPQVSLKANMASLSLKPLLAAAAGFDQIEGAGNLQVDISGGGGTMQTLMSSLAGNGRFDFGNGQITGVNLTELVKGAKTSLANKSLPLNAFGPTAQTKFNNLNASFTMKDGVATMSDLKLASDLMNVTGVGGLDIGGQKLSLSLNPEFKSKSEGVNGFGLPVKLAGSWTGVGVSFDFDALIKRAAGDVKGTVANKLQEQLTKQLGGSKAATPAQQAAPGEQPAKPESTEDALKKKAKNALGGLLKGN